mgnify:CR=1 FL=1
MKYSIFFTALALTVGMLSNVAADTSDQKWMTKVEISKQGMH